jgi:hypothetical protein
MGDPHQVLQRRPDSADGTTEDPSPAPPGDSGMDDVERRRHWYIDEVIVAAFAFLGLAGGVLLPLRYPVPPITTSFLLATGLAALTYRYLGGIQGATFSVGALKLGGALAALVGIAMLINQTLAKQSRGMEVYEVSGQVLGDGGHAIQPLDAKDIGMNPPLYQELPQGKFKVDIHTTIGVDGKPEMPLLSISHDGYDPHYVDLNPKASNDIAVTRSGQRIQIAPITLHRPAQPYQPNVTALPVSPAPQNGGQNQ